MTSIEIVLAAVRHSEEVQAPPVASPVSEDELLAHQDTIRRLVRRLLAWPELAGDTEDVVQEVFLAAWAHRGRFRGESACRTWLTKIALNKARDHLRLRHLRRLLLRPLEPEAAVAAPDGGDDVAVRRAMAGLPHRDREVLVLRYLEQRSIAAVAETLGVSRAAVDARLSRARQRLRRILDRGDAR